MPLRQITIPTSRKLGLTVLLLSMLVGVPAWQRWVDSHVQLELDIVTPSDFPEEVELQNKLGEVVERERRETFYPRHFVSGWEECLREFVKRRPRNLRSFALKEFHMPVGSLKQINRVTLSAQTAGFEQCFQQLERLCQQFGGRATRAALRSRYGEWWVEVHESTLRLHPQAAAIARKRPRE